MKVIDAIWEKENLGKNVAEVIFDNGDTIEDFRHVDKTKFDYVLVKMPIQKNEVVHELENEGYRYIENIFTLQKKISTLNQIPPICFKFINKYNTILVSSQEDINVLLDEIGKGIFTNDRITNDPIFDIEDSSKRYANWIQSIFDKKLADIFFIKDKNSGKNVGFFIMQKYNDIKVVALLSGLFNDFKRKGIGIITAVFPLLYAKENNYKLTETYVSSNNVEMLSMLSAVFAYEIRQIKVVLRNYIG